MINILHGPTTTKLHTNPQLISSVDTGQHVTNCSVVTHNTHTYTTSKWSHNEETRELPGERNNARNNARCTKARKATHGLDGQLY